jgi:hypothetical protein
MSSLGRWSRRRIFRATAVILITALAQMPAVELRGREAESAAEEQPHQSQEKFLESCVGGSQGRLRSKDEHRCERPDSRRTQPIGSRRHVSPTGTPDGHRHANGLLAPLIC